MKAKVYLCYDDHEKLEEVYSPDDVYLAAKLAEIELEDKKTDAVYVVTIDERGELSQSIMYKKDDEEVEILSIDEIDTEFVFTC